MDTELISPAHDGGDSPDAFRKPLNEGSSRKYRRRALADDGSSSSEGSQQRDQSPNPKHSKGDARKVSETVHERKDDRWESERSRYSRGSDRYSRDDNHGSKRDEYNRHERDVARSSNDSRGERRRVERYDSEKHSRDKYSKEKGEDFSSRSRRRHTESRMEDKDEKRGSRWKYGDRHKDSEENKEKEVHVKSPRDRSDGGKSLAAEDRDNRSKKLKGFTSEKFTHEEEKHTSSFKPPLSGGTLQSRSKEVEAPGDVDAAKLAAMQAAQLGYLTTDQKKKLLWGKKKSTAVEEPAHRWDSALVGDRERQEKFNKLMGVKGSAASQKKNQDEVQAEKQKELQMDLEKQYTAGLRRRDGRTVGLGL